MQQVPKIKPEEKEAWLKNSMRWLYEMEVLDQANDTPNPVINNMVLNFLVPFKTVKDAELIITNNPKSIIIYLKLNFMGYFKFIRRRIANHISENLHDLLPNYNVTIITKRSIFDKKLESLKQAKEVKKSSFFEIIEK